eukprot:gene9649-10478_t
MSRVLHECKFIPENDFSYLSDDSKWIRRLSYRVTPEEMKEKVVSVLKILLNDLETQPDKLDLIIEKIFGRGAEHTYLIEVKLSELDFNQRKEIEACFVASVIRYLILKTPAEKRDTSQAREEFRKRLVEDGVENSYADFMQNEVGSDIELTCLYRFERAVLIAKNYISGNRNKGLFLSVGSLLEGSDDFTKYITGDHESKETKSRVLIVERLAESLFSNLPLSRETIDLSSIGIFAGFKRHDNLIFREYLGKKMQSQEPVRIKVYNSKLNSLFYREVELLKKLNPDDCVVKMLGFFEVRNSIIFENFCHRKISDLVGAGILTVLYVWFSMIKAVEFVHRHGVVIRNLNPENIYLFGPAHNPRVKLADFSLAITSNNLLTANATGQTNVAQSDEVESTLDYALLKDFMFVAPEVFTKQAGFKSDVWSLGLLGLFLVKHVIPWKEVQYVQEKAEEAEEECEQKMREMLDRLIWLEEDTQNREIAVFGALKRVITSCLHVSVKQRAILSKVAETVDRVVSQEKVREEKEKQSIQCLSSFLKCTNAAATVTVFDKLERHRLVYSSDKSFSALPAHKTLLNGRFIIIYTLLRRGDYECHLVRNNITQKTQILKHIKKTNILNEELSLLRKMSSQVAISKVEDYEDDGFQKYVAVGWLEGGWLLNVLNDYEVAGQRMSEKCLQSVAGGLVSAMKYLHGRGIIYRGLNLSRVLAKRVSEDEMIVKLWDFGPAMIKDEIAMSSSVGVNSSSSCGSSAYPSTAPSAWMRYPEDGEDGYYCMAPELLRNLVYIDHKQKYDERVDAWSVGMVLYLLVEGKSCFSVGDARSVLESIENRQISEANLTFSNVLMSDRTKDVIASLLRVVVDGRLTLSDELMLKWFGLKEINSPPITNQSSDFASRKRSREEIQSPEESVKRLQITPMFPLIQDHADSRRNADILMSLEFDVKNLLQKLQYMKENYLKYEEYRNAVLNDDFVNADRLSSELSDIDVSELSDLNRFKATYSMMLESLNNAMASREEKYKADLRKKKDMENFFETLSSK